MRCNHVLLEDYVEELLTESEKQEVKRHLQSCYACEQFYQELLQEQKQLKAYLEGSVMQTNQVERIMQQITQTKKNNRMWQSIKIACISVAVILLVVFLINRPDVIEQTAINPTDSLLPEDHPDTVVIGGPLLNVSIERVVENGENYDISYRVQFEAWYQEKQREIFNQIMNTYHYIAPVNQPYNASFYDEFYQSAATFIQFAIRDEKDNLLVASKTMRKGEVPVLNHYSLSGREGLSIGERIYTISIPKSLKPSKLEVLQMEAIMFDPFMTEIETNNLSVIELHDGVYQIEELAIQEEGLVLVISVEEQPERLAKTWAIQLENQIYSSNESTFIHENGRMKATMIFHEIKAVPEKIGLLPLTVQVVQDNELITVPINVGKK